MTFELLTLPQSRLYNAEFLAYHTQIEAEINANVPALNLIKPSFLIYAKILSEVKAVFIRDKASALTPQIEAADHDRDSYLTGLQLTCEAQTHYPDAATQEAARLLLHHIGIYGKDIQSQGISAETVTLESLIKDFKTKPSLMEALTLTKADVWIPHLEAANKLVASLYKQRNDEQAQATAALPYKMLPKRKELVAAWDIVFNKIAGYNSITDGAAPWDDLVTKINALTKKYQDLLAARAGRAAADDEEAGPEVVVAP